MLPAAETLLLRRRSGRCCFNGDGLHRQAHAALVVGFDDLDLDYLAFLEVIGDGIYPLGGDLRNVQQAILARQQADDGLRDITLWLSDYFDFNAETEAWREWKEL